ncbi:Rad52/Rad22 family DNA repair protein [Aquisphaera insulae]|uniref:Rad52/Rad22 family DNA repair protein n=1 Tax=Aquisphaera insulae TaxID=2712864 RepID=UPI0013EADA78|nr:Rad52/Rad22 family DNA repair protein [Aquisphaera insulae]
MEQHLDLFAALAAPFEHEDVRVRPQGNQKLQYVTARAVMNRLDDVVGPANWWDEYSPQENSVICRLTIRLPDGTTLTKSDAGGYAGMSDHGDDDKSGFSDAFKRAAVKFGIGRYLYRDGIPRFVRDWLHANAPQAKDRPHAPHPSAPAPASPSVPHAGEEARTPPSPAAAAEANGPVVRPAAEGPTAPQTGKALFAWLKQQDEKHDLGLLRLVSDWGKREDLPTRMLDWDADQVQRGYAEARIALQASRPASRPGPEAPRKEATAQTTPAERPAKPGRETAAAPQTDPAGPPARSSTSPRREREPAQPRAGRSR